ncbi:MAG TPA: NAD(P)-dependent alcohol dehydrogenase [Acidimicrobiia bacterium]|nr:NAD(P)-dependent alcohol dehydrogenase [Acidimicrobiia bacterium]
MADTMRAAVRTRYGLDAVAVREVPKPDLVDDGVLVRVRATSVNPAEWYGAIGFPYFGRPQMGVFKPRSELLGADFSGTVEAVGPQITHVSPGDEVFGGRTGAFAEYVCVRNAVALKPENISHEEAAAVGTAAITALQALRDHGNLQPDQRVLINGASGGVGTYAVQVAKALGAEVTAVCSTDKVNIARSLGADLVIDYTQTDFTRQGERYDLVIDIAGTRRWGDLRRVIAPDATVVIVGAPKGGPFLGPLRKIVGIKVSSIFRREKAVFFIAKFNRHDMEYLAELIQTGQMRSVIDMRFQGLDQIPDALRYLGKGHSRGKTVVAV